MMVRRRGRLLATGLAALALAVTLAGCGTETGAGTGNAAEPADPTVAGPSESTSPVTEPTEPTEHTESGTVEESPSTTPSTSPAEEEARPEDKPVKVAASGIRGKLLTAEEVPGFNEEFTWREKSTKRGEGRTPFGTCQKFAMTSIGATKVAVRTFRPGLKSPGSTASNMVAEFADEMTAKRAYEVLKSWREQCADQLKRYDRPKVGKLQSVSVDGGATGNWYLLIYGPTGQPDSAYFDAQGMTRSGSTISLVEMRLVGQDYNYPRGQEPMVDAVETAAARLG